MEPGFISWASAEQRGARSDFESNVPGPLPETDRAFAFSALLCVAVVEKPYTGVAVFLVGLKNGSVVTFTLALSRIASMVISICNGVPGFEYSV